MKKLLPGLLALTVTFAEAADRPSRAFVPIAVTATAGAPAAQAASPAPLATHPDDAAYAALDARMRALVDTGRRTGLVWAIAREGAPPRIAAHGFGDKSAGRAMAPDSIFRIYSMTRAVSGVALLKLVEQGKIDLDAPVARYIPQLANREVLREVRDGRVVSSRARSEPTVRQLLTYTSGFAYGAQYPPEAKVDHRDILALDQTIDQGMSKLARYPLRDDPGARWRYGYHSDVIGRLIEIGSGQRTDDYLQQAIFGPLGMVDTGFFVPPEKAARLVRAYDASGADITARLPPSSDYLGRKPFQSNGGGLVTTAPDWIRFARMLLNGGTLDGVRILQASTVAQMTRNQITAQQGPLFWHDAKPGDGSFSNRFDGYGWGWTIGVRLAAGPHSVPGTPDELTWGGLANTYYLVDRRNRLVALAFAQYLGANDGEADLVIREALYGATRR